jgi:Zn-dependent metalloprotease
MKSIFYGIIVLLFTCTSIFAQPAFLQKETDGKGNITFARFGTDTAGQPLSRSAELLKSLYSARQEDEIRISEERETEQDELGYTHRFHQQYYRGVRVEGGEFSVHALKGNIKSILGTFIPVGEVDVTPVLSEAEALEHALKHIGAKAYKWQITEEEAGKKEYYSDTYYPRGELTIVRDRLKADSAYRLAYRFSIYAHQPVSSDYVWVDAITGEVISRISRIMFANATGTAATRYSGTRTITTDSYNGSYRLRETRDSINISTFNMNHTGHISTDLTDADNNWTAAEYHNAGNDDAVLDAHWGAEMTYEYFKQVHAWNKWKNGHITSYVNADLPARDTSYDDSRNAAYVPDDNDSIDIIIYGQGDDLTGPFTPLDICAHEIGHKFCSSTAKLNLIGEPAALNEGLSDIWGACVENWATTGKETWVAGGDLTFSLSQRRLSSPKTYNAPDWDPNADEHINCRVIDFWFYLLSQGGSDLNAFGNTYLVAGIGIEKAAKIVFRAERWYLNSTSGFHAFREATISSAREIYGDFSPETAAVSNAWYAVGVGAAYPAENAITGPSSVCHSGSIFTLPNAQGTTVIWQVTGPFNISIPAPAGNLPSVFVTRTGFDRGVGSLTAYRGGITIAAATKTILACAPTITGSRTVCPSETFTLSNVPSGTAVQWNVTGSFTLSNTTNTSATVNFTGQGYSNGTLTVSTGGTVLARRDISSCPTVITGPDVVCIDGSTFTMVNTPANVPCYWSVSGPFILAPVTGNHNSAIVTSTGISGGSGSLSIRAGSPGGVYVASKTITSCTNAIVGPSRFHSPETYTLFNVPQGATVQWSAGGGPFTLSSTTNTSATVVWTGTGYHGGTIAASIGGTVAASKNISPCLPEITGPNVVYSASGSMFTAHNLFTMPGVNYVWSCSANLEQIGGTGNSRTFRATAEGNAWVRISASSSDDAVPAQLSVYASMSPVPVTAYPNPASSILNIEIDGAAVAARLVQESGLSPVTGGKQLRQEKERTFDIRLYDGQGNLLRQAKTRGGTVQWSVANLPAGIYYLHIYDGLSDKPEMRQIVVD